MSAAEYRGRSVPVPHRMIESSGTRSRPGNGRSPLGPGGRPPATHPEGADAVRVRITLSEIEPAPWRVVEVPLSLTLAALHNVIQAAFCWWNYHLWEFQVGNWRVEIPDPEDAFYADPRPLADARRFPLSRCLTWGVDTMNYLYDFGDYWNHEVRLENGIPRGGSSTPCRPSWRAPGRPRGRTPGGPFTPSPSSRKAVADPFHAEREDLLIWYGGTVQSRKHPRGEDSSRGWPRSGPTGWRAVARRCRPRPPRPAAR